MEEDLGSSALGVRKAATRWGRGAVAGHWQKGGGKRRIGKTPSEWLGWACLAGCRVGATARLFDEAEGEGVAVELSFVGFEGGEDGHDGGVEGDGHHQGDAEEADEEPTEGGGEGVPIA